MPNRVVTSERHLVIWVQQTIIIVSEIFDAEVNDDLNMSNRSGNKTHCTAVSPPGPVCSTDIMLRKGNTSNRAKL